MSYLETSPELAATLQKAQTAWVQFRDANCAYSDQLHDQATRMKLFRIADWGTTIYRRVHLHWSVGD
jgi:uncharacterized protein YecT (DUF1311 family)